MKSLLLITAVTLEVALTSVIIESPQSTRVSEGAPVTLSCRINPDFRRYQVEWYKNGHVFNTENSLHRLLKLPDGSLFFLSSEVSDSGKYHCVVLDENHEDIEISYDAVVTVLSEDDYYDYHDSRINDQVDDGIEKVHDEIETVTKVRDAIKEESDKMDGHIVMQIEAKTVGKEVLHENGGEMTRNDIPLVFWVICLSVVSFMTLLVIFGAGFIICKIKNMKNISTDIENGPSNIYEKPVNSSKRLSWIETPWNFYQTNSTPLKTFRNHQQSLLNTSENTTTSSNNSSDYDYASSDYFLLTKAPSEKLSQNYNCKSNHYASSNVKN